MNWNIISYSLIAILNQINHDRPLDAARSKIRAKGLNPFTTSPRSPVFEVNRIVQLQRSGPSSRQTAMTLLESFLVADKNARLSAISISRWNGSWYEVEGIERACGCGLSFGLSGHLFSRCKIVTASIKLFCDVLLDISVFIMMMLGQCVVNRVEMSFVYQGSHDSERNVPIRGHLFSNYLSSFAEV